MQQKRNISPEVFFVWNQLDEQKSPSGAKGRVFSCASDSKTS